MTETKTMVRFFTIADFEEEEAWLREQHNMGWKLAKATLPCFYTFDRCEPEDVIYRLDFKNGEEDGDYYQMFRDYGWEYFEHMAGWLYFRKPAAEVETEAEGEIFSDGLSKVEMVKKIVYSRMLPLLLLFFCCVLPNLMNSLRGLFPGFEFLGFFFGLMFGLYLFLFIYCGVKLSKLKKKYEEQ